MKRFLIIPLALGILFSCNRTENNDPWGKIDEEQAAKESKVAECTMHSSFLKQDVPYSVWLPKDYDENKTYPFLYLLHGYEYGDQSRLDRCWLDKGNAAAIAEDYQKSGGVPMVIVMPNGYSYFYMGDYEPFFEEELMAKVEADYKCNGKRAIAGLSMGGFGTLFHALKYPGKFTCAYAMSPASKMFGLDPGSFIDQQSDKSVFPSFTIEVGTEDIVVNNSESKALYQKMTRSGIECEWEERAGAHTWEFWKVCLPKALRKAGASFQ